MPRCWPPSRLLVPVLCKHHRRRVQPRRVQPS